MEHKLAAYRYHFTRMHSLPLTPERKQAEWTLIQLIAQNNNFPTKIILNLNQKTKHKRSSLDENNGDKNKMWTTFTYYSPKIRKITKSIHKNQHRNSVQNYQYYSTAHQTNTNQQYTRNRQEWNIQSYV